jgi:predicted acyl esterase
MPFYLLKITLPRGFQQSLELAAFHVNTIFKKDQVFPMRDGVKLYSDIFHPTGPVKVPAIVMWSPYGKSGNGKFWFPRAWTPSTIGARQVSSPR